MDNIVVIYVNEVVDKMVNKTKHKKRGNVVEKIYSALKNSDGLTITEIVKKTKLNRSSVRTALAKLDGAGKVNIRKVGMAKVYLINGRKGQSYSFIDQNE